MNKLKVLMVDDESRMRKLVNDFLSRKNYEVIEAGDGEEAIDKFYADKDIASRPGPAGRYDAGNGRMGSLQTDSQGFQSANYYVDGKR